METTYNTAERLLDLPDPHRALLAEFDYFPAHDLLYVRWHGHLTAPAIVQGAQASLDLFRGRPLPHRLLSNHRLATGDWAEAVPWLHYEWLPQILERGVGVLSQVLPHELSSPVTTAPGGPELVAVLKESLLLRSFRNSLAAWQWAITRP